MSTPPPREVSLEDLAAQLAVLDEQSGSPPEANADPGVLNLKAELDNYAGLLRRQSQPSQYSEETACGRVTEKARAVARDAESVETTIGGAAGADNRELTRQALPLGNLGAYELISKLGEGGMGAVYKARHTKLDKFVAIKLLPSERMKDPSAVERFEREMRAVGKLEHANIVRAMDAGEVGDVHYLVMEYVQGLDLAELLKIKGPLPIAEACELIRQVLQGLDEAYANGMVHRDLKPSNIMLCVVNSRTPPVVKILDLGLALLSDAHAPAAHGLTTTGQMMGTLDYMAPEQGGDSKNVDIRVDIYSLGATLYKLLCGETIYHGEKYQSPVQKMMALATHPAPPIQSRRPEVSDHLAAVLHRMLEKNPDNRFASPAEAERAIQPFCLTADLWSLLQGTKFDLTPPLALSAEDKSAAEDHDGPTQLATEADADRLAESPAPLPVNVAAVTISREPAPQSVSPTVHQRIKTISAAKKVPAAAKTSPGRNVPPWLPLAGGLLGFGGLVALALAMIFYFQTPTGTLRVEINDPTIEVSVKGTDIVIQGAEKEAVKLTPGEKTLVVKRGDFTFETSKLVLKKGEVTTVSVELLAGQLQVVSNGQVIGSKVAPPKPQPASPAVANLPAADPPALGAPGEYVLQFNDPDGTPKQAGVVVPGLTYSLVAKKSFTLELWIKRDPRDLRVWQIACFGPVALMPSAGDPLKIDLRWYRGFVDVHRTLEQQASWTHLAGVRDWDAKEYRLYCDGKLAGRKPIVLENEEGSGDGVLEFAHSFNGQLGLARLSSNARYEKDFEPPRDHTPDQHTLALYEFAAGSGDELKDSSGHDRHGKIVGGKWVRSQPSPDASSRIKAAQGILAAGGELILKVDGAAVDVKSPRELPADELEVVRITFSKTHPYSAEQLPRILTFPEVAELELTGPLTDADLPKLGSLPQLTYLQIDSSEIRNGLNERPGFAALRKLHLGPCENLDGVLVLAGFQSLQEFSTYTTPVRDISQLADLPNLRNVNLFDSRVTDDGARFTRSPPGLVSLYLDADPEFTDKGLQALTIAKNLRHVRLDRTAITRAGAVEFQKSLPDCKVEFREDDKTIVLPPQSELE